MPEPSKTWTRPISPDPEDRARVEEQARRRRMLTGRWGDDLERWLVAHFGQMRRDVMGPKDLSSNFLVSITRQLATLYDNRPMWIHPSGPVPELFGEDIEIEYQGAKVTVHAGGYLDRAGLPALLPRFQQMVLGVNDYAMHIGWRGRADAWDQGGLCFRPLHPDLMDAVEDPANPGAAIAVRYLQQRKVRGELRWTWDEYDITDPDVPSFRVVLVDANGQPGEDITAEIHADTMAREGIKDFLAENYPWRRTQGPLAGDPFIPVVFYHRSSPVTLWSPWDYREAVDGSYNLAAFWTFWGHGVKNASFLQRWISGGKVVPVAIITDEQGRVHETHAGDPAAVVHIEQDPAASNVQVGQWQSSQDPRTLGEAIAAYEARLASAMGVDPADIVRQSGDPRSGYALAISQAAKQEARRRFAPVFRPSDEELLWKAACIVNLNTGKALPEDGYIVEYQMVDQGATPGDETGGPVQDTALNGAQVTAMQGLLEAAAAGTIPADSVRAMLSFAFQLGEAEATQIMANIGNGFVPTAQEVASFPAGFAAPDSADDPEDDQEDP